MRVLFVGQPGLGHLLPMLALADALIAADDDVTFVTGADVCVELERRGYRTAAAGVTAGEQRALMEAKRPPIVDPYDGMRFAYGTMFTQEQAPRMLPDLLSVIDREQPDLLVHESAEFATHWPESFAASPLSTTATGSPGPVKYNSWRRRPWRPTKRARDGRTTKRRRARDDCLQVAGIADPVLARR